MHRSTKIISVFLTLVIVVSVFFITASAIGETSGTCGDNLNWILDLSTKTLTISGTGSMTDYSSSFNSPWYFRRSSIKTVIIEDGVTSIGDYSFYYHQEIISVTIPDSVTEIGEYAFKYCSNLENIRIPDGVTVVSSSTFAHCSKITSITIPNSVTTIEELAFFACYSLTDIIIPDSVILIGESAFESCRKAQSITIGNGVKTIGKWAFAKCDSLTEIAIPANVITIECTAFSDCESLGKITVDSNNLYYSNDDYGVLFNKDKTTLVQYPSGSASTNYVIPNSVTTLCTYAFCYASNLESVTIPDSITSLDDFVFDNKYDLILYYKGTQAQWDELLANNSETSEYLKNYTVICADNTTYPSGICGDNLIWLFNAETNTLTISGTGAMYDYEIDDVSGFINQPWYNFSRDIKHIVVEDGVTSIGEAAFTSCDATDITIGDSVASIGSEAIKYCDYLTEIIVDEDNQYYSNDEFGVLFNKDKTTLIHYPIGNQRENYTIPDGVKVIGTYAFDKCNKTLLKVTIPKSVTTIEKFAFNVTGFLAYYKVDYVGTQAEWNLVSVDGTNDIAVTYLEQEHKHDYESVVTAPTCTEQGYTTYTCECGDTYVDDYVDALGHTSSTAVEENYVAPTCTENGSKDVVVYCSVCYEEISRETVVLEATGHADNDGNGYCDVDNELLDPLVECEHACHKDGLTNLIWKIINFLNQLLGLNNICSCGVAHY